MATWQLASNLKSRIVKAPRLGCFFYALLWRAFAGVPFSDKSDRSDKSDATMARGLATYLGGPSDSSDLSDLSDLSEKGTPTDLSD